jgi:hypothetical protein
MSLAVRQNIDPFVVWHYRFASREWLMKTYRPPINEQTNKPIKKKSQQGHAIQAIINEGNWVSVTEIFQRVKPLGLGITLERVQEHLDFEQDVRKRLRKNVYGKYMLLGDSPKWRTANPDGTPK